MAWAASTLSAGLQAALAADKPLFVAGNLLYGIGNAVFYNWDGTGSFPSGANDSLLGFPSYHIGDGRADLGATWETPAGGESQWIDSNALAGTFDSFFMVFDPGTATADIGITVQIADSDDYLTNPVNIYQATVSSGSGVQRAVSFNLNSFTQYTGTGYVNVRFYRTGGGTLTSMPTVYEIVLGRRYQLSKKSQRPWSRDSVSTNIVTHESESGVATRYTRHVGRHVSNQTWQLAVNGGAYGLDDITTFRNFWYSATNYGSRSFVYCEDPGTSPELARLVYSPNPDPGFQYTDAFIRMPTIEMRELPPFAGVGL